MASSLRIVVTGLAATYPFGGVFWDYLQYLLGFHRLGHDVLYIEDTGKWFYDPVARTFVESGQENAEVLGRQIRILEPSLTDRWFVRDATGANFGCRWRDVVSFCREADLLLHLSASCLLREEYAAARRIAFLDSDPVYTQAALLSGTVEEADRRIAWWKSHHDVFFTFAANMGAADCRVPDASIEWVTTRQPVVLDAFREAVVPVSSRRGIMTTVASWEPAGQEPVVAGVKYRGKSAEFERFMRLPDRVTFPIELALSGPAPRDLLAAHGWLVRDAYEVSYDPWVYRSHLAHSAGEWSVAKNAYVSSRSGWFSCRTACYLALGIPAVVQDTGFGATIPTGEGVIAFRTLEEAVEGIERVASDLGQHAQAARAIAEEYFASDKVLTKLLERTGV